jgi:hypothetical protein
MIVSCSRDSVASLSALDFYVRYSMPVKFAVNYDLCTTSSDGTVSLWNVAESWAVR